MQIFFRLLTGLCAAVLIVAYLGGRDVSALPKRAGAVTFVDRNGATLGTILGSDSWHAASVPLSRVSPLFQQAIVAAEDARFARHGAVDLAGLMRAVSEFFVYGEFRSGGSTIAMQLARLLHPSASTLRGKLTQILVAERLAMRSEKRDLLEAYVNRVPMGGNLYGVEAASRTYFGSPASDLDLAQAALLAAIPNDPVALAPDEHLDAARARQRYVVNRMLALREIDADDRVHALDERLAVADHDSGIIAAAHALFYLYPHVENQGHVRTTIDRGLQRFVEAQVREVLAALASRHVTDAAVLVVDNHTGVVLAYAGSPDYFSDSALGRNDGVQALRQPGSSLKPFTYELALERRTILSTTILPDVPSTFAIANGELYQPADYSGTFSGPVRVRYALANSLNVPAVRVLSSLGPQALLERLHDLGFTHLDKPASFYGLGLTLGGGEVSLWENVRAYVTMARNGDAIPLRLIASSPVPSHRIGDDATWSLITGMLADPHARVNSFGYHSVLDMPFDAAVKTGTSSDFRDTWTIGFTRDYTVGVWAGNFDGSAMRDVSGVTGAGPLWNRIMLHLHESNEPRRFDSPKGYVLTSICATTGHSPSTGCPAVVDEWVRPADLASVRRPSHAALGHEYDAWLAQQPQQTNTPFRIVFPSNYSTFYENDSADALQRQEQQLAFRAAGARGPLLWTVNGRSLKPDAEGNVFWPLALGRYTIVASDGAKRDTVTIAVRPQPQRRRPGFTFETHR